MGENKKSRVARVSDLKFSAFQPAAMDNHRPERLSAKKYSPYQPSSEKYFRALNESAKCAIVQTTKSRIPAQDGDYTETVDRKLVVKSTIKLPI